MNTLSLKADIGLGLGKYSIQLSLIEFMEDGITIIYSPALDLSGYGNDMNEARDSFKESLQEFFRYAHNKKTIKTVLENLGWNISKRSKSIRYLPPKNSDLISKNDLYTDIINNKQHRVYKEKLELA